MNEQTTAGQVAIALECDHCGTLRSMGTPVVFYSQEAAESHASRHVDEHPEHVITGTRPAHNHAGSIPVILFTAKKQ